VTVDPKAVPTVREGRLVVLRDTRERKPWAFPTCPVETRDVTLSTGDYAVPAWCVHDECRDTYRPRFAVERKSGQDLLTSLTWERERFERELRRARDWPLGLAVVVEASWTDIVAGRGPVATRAVGLPQVVGTLAAWLDRYNVTAHFAGTRQRAQQFAWSLLVRSLLCEPCGSTRMPFGVSWRTLLDELDELPPDATLRTPLSQDRFRVTDVQKHRVVIEFPDGETRPLQREQFETLYERITDDPDGFELDRLPPNADPFPAVLSLHPRFEIDEDRGVIVEHESPTATQRVDGPDEETDGSERTEPDMAVYADALLLVDALERHDVTALEELETDVLVDLYTLLSDVQRDADDVRKEIADVLLGRLHHDRPASSSYGSVQRTARRNRSLKNEETVLAKLEAAGIDREQVTGLDRSKVDDALAVTNLSESDVYEIETSEYVRKADVDEDTRETRLQGLKDRLADSDDEEVEDLREEIEQLEGRIDELTSFRTGAELE
jgi:hypothetical protein